MKICMNDFKIFNQWEIDRSALYADGSPKYLIDRSTGKQYLNEDTSVVRFKCLLLTMGTIPVHLIASIVKVANDAIKAISCFFAPNQSANYNLKSRLNECGNHLLAIARAPLFIALLELSSIFGVFSPYNGRKLYASLERAHYGDFILAPCFQPKAQNHLFGGDINQRNAF